jgi:hypothetical protein
MRGAPGAPSRRGGSGADGWWGCLHRPLPVHVVALIASSYYTAIQPTQEIQKTQETQMIQTSLKIYQEVQ